MVTVPVLALVYHKLCTFTSLLLTHDRSSPALQMKKELVTALKPTAESIAQISQSPELLAGGQGGSCLSGGPDG